jgi:hypothetical protein
VDISDELTNFWVNNKLLAFSSRTILIVLPIVTVIDEISEKSLC